MRLCNNVYESNRRFLYVSISFLKCLYAYSFVIRYVKSSNSMTRAVKNNQVKNNGTSTSSRAVARSRKKRSMFLGSWIFLFKCSSFSKVRKNNRNFYRALQIFIRLQNIFDSQFAFSNDCLNALRCNSLRKLVFEKRIWNLLRLICPYQINFETPSLNIEENSSCCEEPNVPQHIITLKTIMCLIHMYIIKIWNSIMLAGTSVRKLLN